MALCCMKELIEQAAKQNRAVGAFSVGSMEMVLGAVQAAEEMNTPIILQIAQGRLKHSPLHLMAPMMVNAAKACKLPIAVHFDHGATYEVIKQALDFGFTSVMFDGSALPFAENIQKTRQIRELADTYGAFCEAELGLVGGSEGGATHGVQCTNPDDAAEFCEKTGIKLLAVAIGNAHGNYPVSPKLRFDVLEELGRRVNIPFVLHGGSGITDEDFRHAIDLGIRKINIATASFDSLVDYARAYVSLDQKQTYFGLNEAMVQGVCQNVKRHIQIFNNQ